MKKILSFALLTVLAITFVSFKSQPQVSLPAPHADTIQITDTFSLIEKRIYTYTCEDGHSRAFFDVYWHMKYNEYFPEMDHNFGVMENEDKHTKTFIPLLYQRYEDIPDYFAYIGGCPCQFHYTVSPDKKYLYLVTCVQANSNGWTSEYQLFKVDCETTEVTFICECAAIAAIENGFVVAKARLTNPETTTCTADEIWVLHDEYLDWNGKVVSVDKHEYKYKRMEKKYQHGEYTYVRGFYR